MGPQYAGRPPLGGHLPPTVLVLDSQIPTQQGFCSSPRTFNLHRQGDGHGRSPGPAQGLNLLPPRPSPLPALGRVGPGVGRDTEHADDTRFQILRSFSCLNSDLRLCL